MGIPPGVPVTAAKVHGALPLVLSRGLSRHTTASTPSGACPGVPAAWLRAAALRSLGKYSLSETDVLRSANDANGAMKGTPNCRVRAPAFGSTRRRSAAQLDRPTCAVNRRSDALG